jgi:hypothetical protein
VRERFDLDLPDLARATYLIHGNYGVGKTFLLGDALKYEMSLGHKAHFLSFKDEEGHNSITNLGLGKIAERVETYDDFIAALADCKKDGVHALGIDNLKWLGKATIKKHCGDRLPSVGRGSDDWQKIHKDFEDAIDGSDLWRDLPHAGLPRPASRRIRRALRLRLRAAGYHVRAGQGKACPLHRPAAEHRDSRTASQAAAA